MGRIYLWSSTEILLYYSRGRSLFRGTTNCLEGIKSSCKNDYLKKIDP
jgi:hypothetical protein